MSAIPPAHEPLPVSLRDRFDAGEDFDTVLASTQANAELWAAVWRRAVVPHEFVTRVEALGGAWHLLALSADWCGDAVNTLPVIAKLAGLASNVDLRVLDRDEHLELMDMYLTGSSRSIPAVLALDAEFVERGWWGPRPSDLQAWTLGEGQALDKVERYKHARTWYARDRAVTTLEEIVSMLEAAARSRR